MSRRKLSDEEIAERAKELSEWKVDGIKLRRRFEFENFVTALEFVNKAGDIAEAADHHPDITFGWGYAEFELTTHDTGGLTELDFVVAGRIDQL